MVADHKEPNLEIPEEELIEELSSDTDDEQFEPLDSRATSVSEADWAGQQMSEPLDEDDREE
ncbi:MAG: hypothetical protein HLX51_08965 [Micrococcaceae bacterium]|nr:hypothetical protein [Micrococcaceae bacterium]